MASQDRRAGGRDLTYRSAEYGWLPQHLVFCSFMHMDAQLSAPVMPDVSHDAVVIVPGIMGSELTDIETGNVVWGARSARWLIRAWSPAGDLRPLQLTGRELDLLGLDRYDPLRARVRPTGLLRFPTWAPFLAGFEPYSRLLRHLSRTVAHPAALHSFAYDWRLPTRFNAQRLAIDMVTHLETWKTHPAQTAARKLHPTGRPAQIVLIAHSMGGLLVRDLSLIDGATDHIRASVTMGAPFDGAVKAVLLVNTGDGAPLPRQRLKELVMRMPGIYDLLPTYACVETEADVWPLSRADLIRLGADPDLATAALDRQEETRNATIKNHVAIVGIQQPTMQSLSIQDGIANGHYFSHRRGADRQLLRDNIGRPLRFNRGGDGTVMRDSATPDGATELALAQQHGALANSHEAVASACSVVTARATGAGLRLGLGRLGLQMPDSASVGRKFEFMVTGDEDPAAIDCRIFNVGRFGTQVARPQLALGGEDGFGSRLLHATASLPDPGLYRIAVKTGGSDPVTQLILATQPDIT